MFFGTGNVEPEAPSETETLKNQLLRLQADFENARKRWRKEQAEVQEIASAQVLRELLEIFDDFQRAIATPAQAQDSASNFRTGVEMISKRLEAFLKSYGITPIDALGKPFDPAQHEAVAHEATPSALEGTVLAELRRGYIMNGRVLRPAVVKIATAADQNNSKEE